MNVFDIIGPVMIGPSSSHTAGAVRIGRVVRLLLREDAKNAVIRLHGSFAATYKGHGTDKALAGGLMGFLPDDARLRHSLELAREKGLDLRFETVQLDEVHPNTVLIEAQGASGRAISVLGSSIGGGSIVIHRINQLDVEFTGDYHTLLVRHADRPGMVAEVTAILGRHGINIAGMRVYRLSRGGEAIMVIETDQEVEEAVTHQIQGEPGILDAIYIDPV